MFMSVKLTFKDNDVKERIMFEEMTKSLKGLERKINRGDFNVYIVNRYDESCFLMGDLDLPEDVYGEIYVEGDDIYESSVMDRINGTKHWVNFIT